MVSVAQSQGLAGQLEPECSLLQMSPKHALLFFLLFSFKLDYQFIIKGYNSGTARWKGYIAQVCGKGDLLG